VWDWHSLDNEPHACILRLRDGCSRWLWTSFASCRRGPRDWRTRYKTLASTLPLHHFAMRFLIFLALCFCKTALTQSTAVDSYIERESPIAKAGLLANIGSSGSKSSGAKVRFVHPLNLASGKLFRPTGRNCNSLSKHSRSRLFVHLGSRFLPRFQGHHRPVCHIYIRAAYNWFLITVAGMPAVKTPLYAA